METLGELERWLAGLYPLRMPIAVGAGLGLIVLLAVLYRLGAHRLVLRHQRAGGLLAVVALTVLVPTGWYLTSPLWTRTTLLESAQVRVTPGDVQVGAGRVTDQPGASFATATLWGDFVGADAFHFGRGRALIGEVAPGRYTLRVEEFSVRNGPDLYMYLSTNPNGYAPDAINLGLLKATDGAFNYEIPPGTDLSKVRSIIVWCRQFAVLFATATLLS